MHIPKRNKLPKSSINKLMVYQFNMYIHVHVSVSLNSNVLNSNIENYIRGSNKHTRLL